MDPPTSWYRPLARLVDCSTYRTPALPEVAWSSNASHANRTAGSQMCSSNTDLQKVWFLVKPFAYRLNITLRCWLLSVAHSEVLPKIICSTQIPHYIFWHFYRDIPFISKTSLSDTQTKHTHTHSCIPRWWFMPSQHRTKLPPNTDTHAHTRCRCQRWNREQRITTLLITDRSPWVNKEQKGLHQHPVPLHLSDLQRAGCCAFC